MNEKRMYDSWESGIRLFIKGKKHGRMMLDSIDNGLLVYLTIKEDGQTRLKKYSELTKAQQLQDDCDQGEDPIECINKAMAFLSTVASRFQPSNNQLRTSSNPRNQATIQRMAYGKTVYSTKEAKNVAWLKEKLMLADAQEAGQILDEEQLAILADPRIDEAPSVQQTIPQSLAF
uniref:Uncharacterized protein n=1 Tax=Tanacetum cinerariifolium TaxID=118510 RepID=A0A699K9Z4_TANCI|nr:hypothetical protein [Tanacetum cinerariifolium]